MHPLLSQDWTTIRGAASVASLTQSEPAWLDLAPFQDIVGWLEVKELTPTSTNIPTIAYQTAPTKDDALFWNLAPPIVLSTGVTTTILLKNAMPAGCPPCARWFRWRLAVSGGVAWDVTFRLWIAANRIGSGAGRVTGIGVIDGGASFADASSVAWLRPQLPRATSSSLRTQVR